MKGQVLVVDDEQETCDLLEMALERQGFKVTTSTNAQRALELVAAQDFDVVLTDLSMPEMSGLELCERVLGTRPDMPVVVITGQGSLETAIGAIRVGAYDFITKPVDPKLLVLSVSRAIQHRRLHDEVKRLRSRGRRRRRAIRRIVGAERRDAASLRAHRARRRERRVGAHPRRDRHRQGARRARDPRAQPPQGRARSSRSTARRSPRRSSRASCSATRAARSPTRRSQRTGLFVQASGGTLFLDEIGEMPLDMQPKLLRALQERKVRPVGANHEIPFDARIVAATNRDLEDEVDEKRFREDLFYRINVVKIDVPPLRERGGDVLLLAQHFLEQFAERNGKPTLELSTPAAEKLMAYDWPGNVRELENCMERAVALARFDQITVDDLPEKVRAYRAERFVVAANDPTEIVTMDELERRYILRVLSLVGGNKSRAAQVLGFDRRTLYRKLERYGATGEAVKGEPEPSQPPPEAAS